MPIEKVSLSAAWIGILLGLLAGTVEGLFFHASDWLGGDTSWPRRMLRLAHVSLIALALINIALVFSASYLGITGRAAALPLVLVIIGQFSMPLICCLAAFWKAFRHLFFIPVLSLLIAAASFVRIGVMK